MEIFFIKSLLYWGYAAWYQSYICYVYIYMWYLSTQCSSDHSWSVLFGICGDQIGNTRLVWKLEGALHMCGGTVVQIRGNRRIWSIWVLIQRHLVTVWAFDLRKNLWMLGSYEINGKCLIMCISNDFRCWLGLWSLL